MAPKEFLRGGRLYCIVGSVTNSHIIHKSFRLDSTMYSSIASSEASRAGIESLSSIVIQQTMQKPSEALESPLKRHLFWQRGFSSMCVIGCVEHHVYSHGQARYSHGGRGWVGSRHRPPSNRGRSSQQSLQLLPQLCLNVCRLTFCLVVCLDPVGEHPYRLAHQLQSANPCPVSVCLFCLFL